MVVSLDAEILGQPQQFGGGGPGRVGSQQYREHPPTWPSFWDVTLRLRVPRSAAADSGGRSAVVAEGFIAVPDRLAESAFAGVGDEGVPLRVCRAIPSNTVLTIRLVATPADRAPC